MRRLGPRTRRLFAAAVSAACGGVPPLPTMDAAGLVRTTVMGG
jgi:hypothetical protein